ncbi:MAG: hypothetical protein ACOH2E_04550 [Candidatus Paracaedibacter sp.]
MKIYFKGYIFILLLWLTSWEIEIKATDTILREKENLIPKVYPSIQENGTDNKTTLKQVGPTENQETMKFRKKIEKVFEEFDNFESLSLKQQRYLLDKRESMIKDSVSQANFARHGMVDGQFTVSDETWQKLKTLQSLYPEEKHCTIF